MAVDVAGEALVTTTPLIYTVAPPRPVLWELLHHSKGLHLAMFGDLLINNGLFLNRGCLGRAKVPFVPDAEMAKGRRSLYAECLKKRLFEN